MEKRKLVSSDEERLARRQYFLKIKLEREAQGLCVVCGKEPSIIGKRIGIECKGNRQSKKEYRREWANFIGNDRLAKGMCKQCGQHPIIEGFKHCLECKERHRIDQRKRRDTRVQMGLCYRCGKVPPCKDSTILCEPCMRKAYLKEKQAAWVLKQRTIAFDYYGHVCACCGETNERFLTFDHVNNDGAKHRKEDPSARGSLASWLVRHKFPEGFQVLCFNCNYGKNMNGGICPHVEQRTNSY